MQASRRIIQIVRLFLLGSIAMYAGFAWRLPSNVDPNPLIFWVITVVSVLMVIIVFVVRRLRVLPVEQLGNCTLWHILAFSGKSAGPSRSVFPRSFCAHSVYRANNAG